MVHAVQVLFTATGIAFVLVMIGVFIGSSHKEDRTSRKQAEFYAWKTNTDPNKRTVIVASKSPRQRELQRGFARNK